MNELKLTLLEEKILKQSFNIKTTKRRKIEILFFGVIFICLLLALGIQSKTNQSVLIISVMYIIITIFEKITMANGVIAYKGLIQKLIAHKEITKI